VFVLATARLSSRVWRLWLRRSLRSRRSARSTGSWWCICAKRTNGSNVEVSEKLLDQLLSNDTKPEDLIGKDGIQHGQYLRRASGSPPISTPRAA
jgi:hypothetical protein